MLKNIGLTIFLISLFACKSNINSDQTDHIGLWEVRAINTYDSIVRVDYSIMKLKLLINKRYFFINNLNQIEAGTYFLKDSFIIFNDTTKSQMNTKGMFVEKLKNDSLILRLNLNNTEAKMILKKN